MIEKQPSSCNPARILAIGDIHGHLTALDTLLGVVEPTAEDLLVFLGDFVDRGPDVKGVLDRLIEIHSKYRAVFLRGNHDQMMLDAHLDPAKFAIWECLAGENPLSSYGEGKLAELMTKVPAAHWHFLQHICGLSYETPDYIFIHGGIRAEVDPKDEEQERLQWTKLNMALPHSSGRTVICGHSAQRDGIIADLGHTICIDTAAGHGGWLTCLALPTKEYWQANAEGKNQAGKLPSAAG